MTFEGLQLRPALLRAVAECGYETPTPIQDRAIPPVLSGKDVLGLAQTGTGKTAAFALPILERLADGPRGVTRALVVAPTRELAAQIQDTFKALGSHTKLRAVSIYGGVGMAPQVQALRRGTEIVVACPGRLLDHMGSGAADLSKVEVLVLDEADRMFDMGFLPDVRRIMAKLPKERQTLLFSATMPQEIRHLADEALTDPVVVKVGHTAPAETVSHAVYPVAQHLKTALLIELLKRTDTGSVLVFTRTKHRAKRVAEQVAKAGFKATSLQGNLSQNKRDAAMGGFKSGEFQIMVATDIAARGIDVSQISHVINYDMPDTVDAYTHRIGRTGRAEKTGDAFTLVTNEDAQMVYAVERLLGAKIDSRTLPDFDYKSPAPAKNAEFARPPLAPRGRRPGAPGGKDNGQRREAEPGRKAAPKPERRAGQPAGMAAGRSRWGSWRPSR